MKITSKRGDTIVEVLLALAILAAVLSGAYVTTNKSLKAGRDAQERGEALRLAEGQLEFLKSLQTRPSPDTATNPFGALSGGTSTFCLYVDPTKPVDTRVLEPIPTVDFTNPAAYPAKCKGDPPYDYYAMSIERTGPPGNYLFISRVLWQSIIGDISSTVNGTALPGYSEVKLYYRTQE